MFLAIVLQDSTQAVLFNEFAGRGPQGRWFGHHVTIAFQPDEKTLLEFADKINTAFNVKILAFAEDSKGSCLLVKPVGITSKNKFPHITLQMVDGVPPQHSNVLIEQATNIDWDVNMEVAGFLRLLP